MRFEYSDNGSDAGGYDFIQQTNGTYLVEWNTTFANNGQHFIQVGFDMPGCRPPKDVQGVQPVLSDMGQSRIENVNNIIQLDPDDVPFGSQTIFAGTLAVQSADYEIDIYDTNNALINTILGHTDSGALDEVWDLTDTNGAMRNDDEFDVQLYITPTDTLNTQKALFHPNGLTPTSPIPLWRFKNGICGDEFTLAYGWDDDGYIAHGARSDMIMNSVENIIFNPAIEKEYNNTPLNGWYLNPFFMYSTNDQATMLNDLANQSVGNFFFFGHGSEDSFGSGVTTPNRGLTTTDLNYVTVGEQLGNIPKTKTVKGPKHKHPYRLVILDACSCGQQPWWAKAFGIPPTNHALTWFQGRGLSSQALLTWAGEIDACEGIPEINSHGEHLADFFGAWMSGVPLVECVNIGTTPDYGWFPFDRPFDSSWKIFGYPFLTRSPQ